MKNNVYSKSSVAKGMQTGNLEKCDKQDFSLENFFEVKT